MRCGGCWVCTTRSIQGHATSIHEGHFAGKPFLNDAFQPTRVRRGREKIHAIWHGLPGVVVRSIPMDPGIVGLIDQHPVPVEDVHLNAVDELPWKRLECVVFPIAIGRKNIGQKVKWTVVHAHGISSPSLISSEHPVGARVEAVQSRNGKTTRDGAQRVVLVENGRVVFGTLNLFPKGQ